MADKELSLRLRVYKFYEQHKSLGKLHTVRHFAEENVPKRTTYDIIKRYDKNLPADRRQVAK